MKILLIVIALIILFGYAPLLVKAKESGKLGLENVEGGSLLLVCWFVSVVAVVIVDSIIYYALVYL